MTSPISGSYSKGFNGGFDEDERLLLGLMQRSIPLVDADENRKEFQRFIWIRRAIETVIGDASPNNGYKIVGDSSASDFQVSGGDGTLDGAGRIWISGIHCFLKGDIRYVNDGSTSDGLSIFPRVSFITGLTNQVLEDASADYVPGSLVGRVITPDVTQPAFQANILANTARTITTDEDLTANSIAAGTSYRIEMSVPAANRNDGVYINVSLEEIDGTEVPSIRHDLGTLLAAQYFARIRARVEIHESDTVGLPGDLSVQYVDADGFEHFRIKIADITRTIAVDTIDVGDVIERRNTSVNFSNFLNKNGDTMLGDLDMQAADIIMDPLRLVDGRDVSVDGIKLDLIDFTPQGIADQLKLLSAPYQPVNLTGITVTVTNVSEQLRAKTPRGTITAKGVVTAAPENRVIVQSSDDGDDFIDEDGNGVFARLTEEHPNNGFGGNPSLSGTWTFTNAGFTVNAGGGGAALTELEDGDTVLGPDGLQYTVASITNDNAFVIVEPFAGATAPIATPAARRWNFTLRRNNEGTEQDVTPGSDGVVTPLNIQWFLNEVFDLADRPVMSSLFSVPSDQVAAEVPSATTLIAGKVTLAADLENVASKVVQGNDARVNLPLKANNSGGTPIGVRYDTIQAGANITITDLGGGIFQIVGASGPTPGGQTDTVLGTNGITNSGNNTNAVLQPNYGFAAGTIAQGDDVRFGELAPEGFDSGFVAIDFGAVADPTFALGLGGVPRLIQGLVGSTGAGPFQAIGNGDSDDGSANRGVSIYNITATSAAMCPHIAAGSSSLGNAGSHVPSIGSPGVVRLMAWE